MPAKCGYRRVLAKLSGESLCAEGGFGIDGGAVATVVGEIRPVVEAGVELALVVGGGNFIRGRDLSGIPAIHRATADTMGMLATVSNALALRDALADQGVRARVLSAFAVGGLVETFNRARAVSLLADGHVVIFGGGTGNPFFTTDTCAALRAGEIAAEVLLKATQVDGVFDSDPKENPTARKHDRLTYEQVMDQRLGVMDMAAVSLCRENRIPIVVFRLLKLGSLLAAATGREVGTLVTE